MDGETALTASPHATRSVDDGGTSTDFLDAASAIDSDDESTRFSDHPLEVLNLTSSATEADSCESAGSESSSEDGGFERGLRAQPFVAHRLSESLVKVLKLEHVQNKIRQDLGMRGACFKFDKADKTTFLVKQGMKARLDKVLSQKIRTEQFDIHDEDHVELGIVSSLNTKELQNEMVMDYDGKRLTLIYHVTTGSKISESLCGLRTPLREIHLSLAVGRFLEVENNLQRFIATFHRNAAFQVHMEVNKDHQNRSILCVRSNRPHTEAAVSRVKEHIAAIEQRELSISLAKGLYLHSLRGQREVEAIAQQHHCVIHVHTGAQHVLLKASHRDDVLLVCEGSLACCCPQVFILPLCEGQAQWNPHYESIMERGLLSCNIRKHASLIGPPPKPWVHTITSSCGKDRRSIIIMYVPTAANEVDFQRQLKDSCRAAMQAALEVCPEGEVVLPVSLEDCPTSECTALPMLMAVREAVRDNARTTLHLKLFFDTTHPDLPETVVRMEKRLFGCGWSLDRFYGE